MNQNESDKDTSCGSDSCSTSEAFCCAKDCADCDKDDAEAALASGLVYAGVLYPELKQHDEEKAIHYLRQSIEAGDKQAIKLLMDAYLTGKIAGCDCSIKADYNRWLKLCEELANKGHQQVAYSSALWFAGIEKPGKDVDECIKARFKPDADKAIYFLRVCSRGEDPDYSDLAVNTLCHLLTRGNDTVKSDASRLETVLKEEVAKGNSFAQAYLSKFF
ncbi:hypothetical protein FOG18_02180 [Legionella israelensis]|uniref:hypothetical protein n=1 Tax=Legionella israelensis TaxID=454 RepID=UPI00117FC304|nr:hypothetical protein [Legionella israelensis]QDP71465.1 hypothetical protein FOG18_02180 [Legionella israelensis]